MQAGEGGGLCDGLGSSYPTQKTESSDLVLDIILDQQHSLSLPYGL